MRFVLVVNYYKHCCYGSYWEVKRVGKKRMVGTSQAMCVCLGRGDEWICVVVQVVWSVFKGTLCCVWESEATQWGDWQKRLWGWGELTATGWAPDGIRTMTAECPQKTWSIWSCPDSLATMLPEENDYYGPAVHAENYRGGHKGLV